MSPIRRAYAMPKRYTISDGKLVLNLEPAGGGWYAVTSPLDPALITQAKSVEEAFAMAYDAQKALKAARAKLARSPGAVLARKAAPAAGGRASHRSRARRTVKAG